MLGTEVSHYLNLDGEDDTKNNDVAEGTNPSKKFLWMGLGATILIGLGVWWYLKNKKSN
jgi:LPXTG-motif cell wall-anchored protein